MSRTYQVARFFCGCLYLNPLDLALFCPNHRGTPETAYITSLERITTSGEKISPNLGPTGHLTDRIPYEELANRGYNSLHLITYLRDGRNDEWSVPEPDEVGLCAACCIDDGTFHETRVAMCECGDDHCSYRWCGNRRGLHAFWELHAQGRSQETTGILESDIFSHGPCQDQPKHIRDTLDEQRAHLDQTRTHLLTQMTEARNAPFSKRNRYPSAYLSPWLDPLYRDANSHTSKLQRQRNTTKLQDTLLRFHIIGAIPHNADQPKLV